MKEITKEYLYDEFITKRTPYSKIARLHKCSISHIQDLIKKYNINILDRFKDEEDLVGKEFGILTVIEKVICKFCIKWKCKCSCGNEILLLKCDLIRNNCKSRSRHSCGQCRPINPNFAKMGSEHPSYKGYQEITGSFWLQIKDGADKRNIEFNITIEDIWNLYLQQNRKCALTGIPLVFKKNFGDHGNVSLDRIDSKKGYTLDNIQWIYKDLQRMKWAFDENYFKVLCHLVVEHDRKSPA